MNEFAEFQKLSIGLWSVTAFIQIMILFVIGKIRATMVFRKDIFKGEDSDMENNSGSIVHTPADAPLLHLLKKKKRRKKK